MMDLPTCFDELAKLAPLVPLQDDAACTHAIDIIDRLMTIENLTDDQVRFMEAQVALVQAYEAVHYPMDGS